MSDKDAAKRRRQARNRQERINRQKRTEAARPTSRTGSSPGRGGRPSRSAAPAPAVGGGFLGKLFPPRSDAGSKTGDGARGRPARAPQPRESVVLEIPDDDLAGVRGAILRRMAQPGGRATTVAVVLAVTAVVLLFAVPLAPRYAFPAADAGTATREGDGSFAEMVVRESPGTEAERTERLKALEDRDPEALGSQRLTEVLSPVVVAGFALVLLLVVGTAFRALTRPTRSRTLLISSFALVAVMFVLGQILLPLVAALAFASYQSRKADRLAAVEAATE